MIVVEITVGLICWMGFVLFCFFFFFSIGLNSWMGLICCNLLVDLVILV